MTVLEEIKSLDTFEMYGHEKFVSLQKVVDILESEGEWTKVFKKDEPVFFQTQYHCSACGGWNTYGRSKFCPNCGKKMNVLGREGG